MATYQVTFSRKPTIIGCDGARIHSTNFTNSQIPVKYRITSARNVNETAPFTEVPPDTSFDMQVPMGKCLIVWADQAFKGTVDVDRSFAAGMELSNEVGGADPAGAAALSLAQANQGTITNILADNATDTELANAIAVTQTQLDSLNDAQALNATDVELDAVKQQANDNLVATKTILQDQLDLLNAAQAGNATDAEVDVIKTALEGRIAAVEAVQAQAATDAEVETIRANIQTQIDAIKIIQNSTPTTADLNNVKNALEAQITVLEDLQATNATDAELAAVKAALDARVLQLETLQGTNATDAELLALQQSLETQLQQAKDKHQTEYDAHVAQTDIHVNKTYIDEQDKIKHDDSLSGDSVTTPLSVELSPNPKNRIVKDAEKLLVLVADLLDPWMDAAHAEYATQGTTSFSQLDIWLKLKELIDLQYDPTNVDYAKFGTVSAEQLDKFYTRKEITKVLAIRATAIQSQRINGKLLYVNSKLSSTEIISYSLAWEGVMALWSISIFADLDVPPNSVVYFDTNLVETSALQAKTISQTDLKVRSADTYIPTVDSIPVGISDMNGTFRLMNGIQTASASKGIQLLVPTTPSINIIDEIANVAEGTAVWVKSPGNGVDLEFPSGITVHGKTDATSPYKMWLGESVLLYINENNIPVMTFIQDTPQSSPVMITAPGKLSARDLYTRIDPPTDGDVYDLPIYTNGTKLVENLSTTKLLIVKYVTNFEGAGSDIYILKPTEIGLFSFEAGKAAATTIRKEVLDDANLISEEYMNIAFGFKTVRINMSLVSAKRVVIYFRERYGSQRQFQTEMLINRGVPEIALTSPYDTWYVQVRIVEKTATYFDMRCYAGNMSPVLIGIKAYKT